MAIVAAVAVPHPPIIFPEVGRGEEQKIQKTIDAYRAAMRFAASFKPETVVVTSPHATLYADYFHISPGASAEGNFQRFGAPGVRLRADYDEAFVRTLSKLCERSGFPAGTMGEREPELDHGTIIPLRYFYEALSGVRVVRIGLSGLSPMKHYELGRRIAETAEQLGRRVVLIASGDLSHKLKEDGPYGFAPEGPEFDRLAAGALGAGDFETLLTLPAALCEKAAECGLRSFQILAGALDGKAVESKLLSYEGPFGVGYGVATFRADGDDPARRFAKRLARSRRQALDGRKAAEDPWVRLARLSLETYVKTGRLAVLPEDLPPELTGRRAGAFVSLKEDGQLRGCIGTIAATTGCVAEEILQNAVSAGTRDPRFSPVGEEELPNLVYSVDVLGPAEKIDSPTQLDVKRYGVIVRSGGRQGLLLPNLEGVESVERQIDIARQKAGIGRGEPLQLERFEVVRHL